MAEQWKVMFRSGFEFEADMIVQNLQYHGIATKTYSSRAFKLAIGEDSRDFVQVFVPQDDVYRAQEVLSSLDLPGTETSKKKINNGGSALG